VEALFSGTRIADLILGLMLLEALGLALVRWRTGAGLAPADLLATLAAGACLVLALRAGLHQDGPFGVGLWLGAALAAHLWDLRRRWRRQSGPSR
jgi:hypothetical protein